ncbi:ImmA/IrrE family metallo-endopeptidase [Virgibacillus sp. NKC19-16]|uniref:ImmA/IrrE family metallo-endopeptidase n=1 Tax=Virgibacillus salidurans TaxID=2831673 RepID=UPI001F2E91D8|nr:ImmA/IrrE family metallo-endopeptidase [Virgibacillus sp. NKC19-16]UJL47083.1 ImmA/IrrE family metallo-endopeptidase [Virgibacillus sp. NKC19-16]
MISIFTQEAIKEEVKMTVSHYQTNNVYELCNRFRIEIFSNNLGKSMGLLQYYNNQPLIHIHTNAPHKKFSIAYILGYFSFNFDPDNSVLFDGLENQEAITFATELLLTDEMILANLNQVRKLTTGEIAKFFNLPVPAIQIKINGISDGRILFPHF